LVSSNFSCYSLTRIVWRYQRSNQKP
jgi:hypothetical protein